MTPSSYQSAIYDFGLSGSGNCIIKAVAGSGKTTTLVELIKMLVGNTVFLAFNKAIAEELKKRNVNAKTFHGICFMSVKNFKHFDSPNENKTSILIRQNLSQESQEKYSKFLRQLIGLAKNSGVSCLLPDTFDTWKQIVDYHEIEVDNEGGNVEEGIEIAQQLLQWSDESPMVDFDDFMYYVIKYNLQLPRFKNVLVDESQDTNAIQRAVLKKIIMPQWGRLFAVGDPAQAIYGFRGASSNSMELIAKEFNCIELPLTVSYRCAKNIVDYAQQWVPHIEAAPGAGEGCVARLGTRWTLDLFEPEDLVVCRTTRPLISLAYRMLRARKPVRIAGREIGKGMLKLIQKMDANGSIEVLEKNLAAYAAREIEKAREKEDEQKMESINDKVSAIITLIESLEEGQRTIDRLIQIIEDLFNMDKPGTLLSTIHKSKGLEAFAVYWLNSSQCPSKFARQPWQLEQEYNLCYVAATRAQTYLGLIEEPTE